MGPHESPAAEGGAAPRGLPGAALWLDYAVRFIAIGIAAWFGARWLSAPMRSLTSASEQLGAAIVEGRPAPVLDERRGTLEVRQTARVFNAMAQRLRVLFDAQWLLMAAISHDLRTPLARLRLRLETMDAQALDEAPRGTGTPGTQRQRCVADVREMDTLIGDVLGMLREGHERGERERIDAAALVQALVDDLGDQGQAATLVGEPAEAVVLAQATALKRIVGNLIGNALRYGSAAEVSVTRDAHELRIAVADRGPGIAPDQLDAVLQPYYRLDATRQHGTGLGLYIARDLAERNGGRLSLANRPGGGLQATLSLPLA
jgi:signal transduction histidine kinase